MTSEIVQQQITAHPGKSEITQVGGLVISLRSSNSLDATVVVGAPGLPNLVKTFHLGDAALFESPKDGFLEIRALSLSTAEAKFLITRISPRLGFTAGLAPDIAVNAPFNQDEVLEIRRSLDNIYLAMSTRLDVTEEQLDLTRRALDAIAEASKRLGRKDWIMIVAAILSNLCVGAAFAPEAARALLLLANQSLGWVFENAVRLLS